MDAIVKLFDIIQAPGATVMMPVVIFIFSLCMGVKIGKAIRAGLLVGVGFVGLNTMINMMGGELTPAVQAMVDNFGFTLDAVDIGWVPSSAIAFASMVGTIIIPLGLLVNIVMLLTNTTQTINIDIWNYWHFAFTGAMVQSLTGSLPMGIAAAALNMVIVMVIADRTAPGVEEYNGLPGVSIPMGFAAAFAPIAAVFNKIIDLIPGLRDIKLDMEKLQRKLGVFGEPVLIGTIFGLVIGILAGYDWVTVLQTAIALGAALVLIPKMAAVLMEGLLPLSDATQVFIEKHFKKRGKIYVGLDSAVGIGHPVCMTCALVLVPLLMETAAVADPATYGNYVGAFSSICDGCNPLTWAMVKLANLQWAGIAIIAVGLALWNRRFIKKESAALHHTQQA